jgi:hypothetical protein
VFGGWDLLGLATLPFRGEMCVGHLVETSDDKFERRDVILLNLFAGGALEYELDGVAIGFE